MILFHPKFHAHIAWDTAIQQHEKGNYNVGHLLRYFGPRWPSTISIVISKNAWNYTTLTPLIKNIMIYNQKRIMYVLEWRTVLALTRGLFWCLKYQNNTRVSADTVRHESTYIILFLTRHNESINEDENTIFTHHPHVSLARFSFCWWRPNRLLMTSQWPDICDAITWIVISYSLDIDFIQADIHGRSCKNIS